MCNQSCAFGSHILFADTPVGTINNQFKRGIEVALLLFLFFLSLTARTHSIALRQSKSSILIVACKNFPKIDKQTGSFDGLAMTEGYVVLMFSVKRCS